MDKKYEIIEQIGTGCFGSIFCGRNKRTMELVAIKVEPIINNTKLLKNESCIYQFLSGCNGIPKVKWFGKDSANYYMVIELLGKSLETFKNERTFLTLTLTMQIGRQIVALLQTIHDLGLVHRDVKPDNFLFGLNENRQRIYVIDFGFCKPYLDNGEHIENVKTNNLVGSPNYASINAHNFDQISRRDDLESLGYMLMYLHTGKLKWSDCTQQSTIQAFKTGILHHCTFKTPTLLSDNYQAHAEDVADVFVQYLRYVRNLKFKETPDYRFLLELLQ
jgi:serine/threonine protein kinase